MEVISRVTFTFHKDEMDYYHLMRRIGRRTATMLLITSVMAGAKPRSPKKRRPSDKPVNRLTMRLACSTTEKFVFNRAIEELTMYSREALLDLLKQGVKRAGVDLRAAFDESGHDKAEPSGARIETANEHPVTPSAHQTVAPEPKEPEIPTSHALEQPIAIRDQVKTEVSSPDTTKVTPDNDKHSDIIKKQLSTVPAQTVPSSVSTQPGERTGGTKRMDDSVMDSIIGNFLDEF